MEPKREVKCLQVKFGLFFLCVSVPENPPVNVTAVLNGTEVLMTWEGPLGKLNGELQGYIVEYSTPASQQVSQGASETQKRNSLVDLL